MTATKENCPKGHCSVEFLFTIKKSDTPKVIRLYNKLFELEDTITAGPTQLEKLEKLEQEIKEIEDAQKSLQRRIDLTACPTCPYSSSNRKLKDPDIYNTDYGLITTQS